MYAVRLGVLLLVLGLFRPWAAFSEDAAGAGPSAVVVEKENLVEAQPRNAAWKAADLGLALALRDRLRTGEFSRAAVRFTDLSMLRVDELTTLEISPPVQAKGGPAAKGKQTLDLQRGGAYFFSREPAQEIQIRTPAANGALRGTEFELRVGADGGTRLTMFDGEVELGNAQGSVVLRSGEQAEVEVGRAPRKTAMIEAVNIIQWCLYYPGVLDPAALPGAARSRAWAAYRDGDLLGAAEPRVLAGGAGGSGGGGSGGVGSGGVDERLLRAALILSVGQVEKARAVLARVPADDPRRLALEQMIAAVKLQPWSRTREPGTSSEWMAESYYQQSRSNLEAALAAARKATELSPDFGFAWARVAELEFSFGRTSRAMKVLERSLELAPRNAQAHALQGFLLAAENRMGAARRSFDTAIELDGALGNAWLGRGLASIRQGRETEGRHDLQTAAVLEPNRSILRSYLGKAFSQVGINGKANLELDRAKTLDASDPTPWLYSAIQRKQENRYNEAIDDLEKSVELNDNRRVYRSQFLLDQDQAVRNTNLAALYQNNGMAEQSVREAIRAVNDNYASAQAHLFLANSYDALRDPSRILLRYETAWSNELLLSQLLSPVGGGSLSQFVSQQEYSKLFEKDGLGISSVTEYRDTGYVTETGSQFGTFGNVSYALDGIYRYSDGVRPNNGLQQYEGFATFKFQLKPQDSLFLQAAFQSQRNGDLSQQYDPRLVSRVPVQTADENGVLHTTYVPNRTAQSYTNRETQDPGQLLVGLNHEWTPGNHTLALFGRLADRQEVHVDQTGFDFVTRELFYDVPPDFPSSDVDPLTGRSSPRLFKALADRTGRGSIQGFNPNSFDLTYFNSFEIYSGELQHIATWGPNTLIVGGRYQEGRFETRVALDSYNNGLTNEELIFFKDPKFRQVTSVDFERINLYLYDTLQITRWLSVTGGVTYDKLTYPENFLRVPVNDNQDVLERVSPKAGFILQPWKGATVRGAYAKATNGASYEDSVRLEPTQVSGFLQGSRSFAPETLVGTTSGSEYRFCGLSFEQKLPTRTYLGVEYNNRLQENGRVVGVFDNLGYNGSILGYLPSSLKQDNDYREEVFSVSVNQLVGQCWSLGATYRQTLSRLSQGYPDYSKALDASAPLPNQGLSESNFENLAQAATLRQNSFLQELNFAVLYNHPSGFFARAEANWYRQSNDDFRVTAVPRNLEPVTKADYRFRTENVGLAGDNFWQINLLVGYRFYRNQCEVSCGVLDLNDADYFLNPLNPYIELPRSRTFVARVKFNF